VCDAVWKDVDCLLTPTAGTIYRIAEMQVDPIRLNSNLGYYTNFMNLLDYSAVAVPAGFQASGVAQGLPWGVTLAAPAFKDVPLLRLADRFHRAQALSLGATTATLADTPAISTTDLPKGSNTAGTVKVAVCGAHLSSLPLNWQLTQRGGRLLGAVQSAPEYKFYALAGGPVQRPGMVRVNEGGAAIHMEVWELPAEHFGSFVDGIPAPLGIGKVKLADGTWVSGFVCEAVGVEGGTEITQLGNWRVWLARQA
jgi:allophanate hydrolase